MNGDGGGGFGLGEWGGLELSGHVWGRRRIVFFLRGCGRGIVMIDGSALEDYKSLEMIFFGSGGGS